MKRILGICGGETRSPEWCMSAPFDFELFDNENIAIVGPNGGGKSMLVDIITGKHPAVVAPDHVGQIRYISFRDTYGSSADKGYFLQQRWNQFECSEDIPKVGDALERAYSISGEDTAERRVWKEHILKIFGLNELYDSSLVLLSSGELRKFQIAKNLFGEPSILIVDNPFIGLDAAAREQINSLFSALSEEKGIRLLLVLSRIEDIPSCITHVVEVRNMKVGPKVPREDFLSEHIGDVENVVNLQFRQDVEAMQSRSPIPGDEIVRMNNVGIRYGERVILKDLNWLIKKGEKWALCGPNGSGKSTLLSLICADNPQGYACDIALFGKARGSGESIWEIKRHIGYVSPEMHRSYYLDIPAEKIVASGLRDHMGLHFNPSDEEVSKCQKWMEVFGIQKLASRSFIRLSSGEQRLVLLARAFVKNPELLILDEPLHGLDDSNRHLVQEIISSYCANPERTLIMVSHYEDEFPTLIDHRLVLTKNG